MLLLLLLLVLLLLLLLVLVVGGVVVFVVFVVVIVGFSQFALLIPTDSGVQMWNQKKIHSRSDHRIHLICVASLGQPVVSVDATNVFSITQLRHYHSLIGVNQPRTNINTVVSCMVVWHLRPIWQRLYIFIATPCVCRLQYAQTAQITIIRL